MPQSSVVLDAATRFLRTNPELLEIARTGASQTGQSIETLLADAVRRIRRSGFEAVAKQQSRSAHGHRHAALVRRC